MEKEQETTTAEAGEKKTFTQEDVNRFLAEQKTKIRNQFADYEELKSAAEKLKEIEEAGKSEAEKAAAKAAEAEKRAAEAEAKAAANEHRALVLEVAAAKGVPASNITGSTREELEASADALLAWNPVKATSFAPHVPTASSGTSSQLGGTVQSGAERARALLKKNT